MFTFQTYKAIGKALLTKRSPYYIQFYINGKCNLKCRQCNIVETNSRIEEMSLDQVREVAKNLRKVGAGIVLLTGGEPFMHPQLPEIVEVFTREKLNVRLQTAGTKYATEDKLRACYEAGGRDLNISLDSLDLPTSDYINSVPGSGRNAIETIELVSRVFRKDSAILSFGTVLSRFNYREIPAIAEFARRIGWYVSMVPVHIANPTLPKGFRSYDQLFKFKQEQWGELDALADRLIEMKREGLPLFDADRFIRSSVSFLKGEGPTWRVDGVCDSPKLYFAIRPNGDFTTCCDYTLVNPPRVYDADFVENFGSRKIENRPDVQSIVKNCSGCHYGSYPEVTLSVRDPKTFFERSLLVLKSGGGKLKNAPVQSDFLGEIEKIKQMFPDVYPIEKWQDADLRERVQGWSDSVKRKEMIVQDIEERKRLGRVRGQGPDVPIQAEPTP